MNIRSGPNRGLDRIGPGGVGRGQAQLDLVRRGPCPDRRGGVAGQVVAHDVDRGPSDGLVAGVVFAGDPGNGGMGYALSAEQVRPGIDRAIAADRQADLGACRF